MKKTTPTGLRIGRRRFLELSALTLAGSLARDALALTPATEPAALVDLVGNAHAETLTAISERILPRTDTPGAIDAGVPEFFADVLSQVYLAEERAAFIESLAALDLQVRASTGSPFSALSIAEQDALLTAMETSTSEPGAEFFAELRNLTVYGYYTSEAGATTEHRLSNPMTPYNGDIPFAQVGRMWSN